MRLIVFIWLFSLIILFGCSEKKEAEQHMHNAQEQKMDKADMNKSADEQTIYYTCPMESHKHVHSAEEGKCPECNMDLVAAVTASEDNKEFYGCPMESHSHIRNSESGKCPECSMELKPMRLKKDI